MQDLIGATTSDSSRTIVDKNVSRFCNKVIKMISIKAILVIYANFENGFAWKKTLKTTIQKFFLKSQKFTKKDPVERFRFSRTILFAVQSNFIYDSEAYACQKSVQIRSFFVVRIFLYSD